jgi:ATP dependent DNA ligase domain
MRLRVGSLASCGHLIPPAETATSRHASQPAPPSEIKHDGYRLQVRRVGEAVRLFTRRGYGWSARYPAISVTATLLFTLDGEALVSRVATTERYLMTERKDRPAQHNGLAVHLDTIPAGFIGIVTLATAFRCVLEIAVYPDRLVAENNSPESRLDALTKAALLKVKNEQTYFFPEADEAAGKKAASDLIEDAARQIAEKPE